MSPLVNIRQITRNDPLYLQECALRETVLLSQVGLDMPRFNALFPGYEDRFEHFVAVSGHHTGPKVVGCALLLPNHPAQASGKLMQMAVDPQRQGEGIGRLLVTAVEQRAFGELGLTELYCHAQQKAIGFYEQLGWQPEGPTFEEAGIPHLKMVFRPPPPEQDDATLGLIAAD